MLLVYCARPLPESTPPYHDWLVFSYQCTRLYHAVGYNGSTR